MLLSPERAARVVDVVERRLLTPLGLRTLAPGSPGYVGRCEGGLRQRDVASHQGSAWPWLLGPFVEAWVRVRGGTAEATTEARNRFLQPLYEHLECAGLGQVSEYADGDAPHHPGGCPFSAWALGELIRLERVVLTTAAREPSADPRV
jgi:glycogen debranching enzyme